MERVGQLLDEIRARGDRSISGEEIFRLYDTYGIPVDLIAEMAEEEGVSLDREGFETMMAGARAKAKASSKFQSSTDAATFARIAEKVGPVEFVGYDQYSDVPSVVKAIVDDHSGLIVVTPHADRGTTFLVHFPAAGSIRRGVFVA